MNITLSEPQSEIFTSTARFKVAACGRRFGKSFLSIFTMIDAAAIPNSRIWYVTSSYRACKSIIWEPLKEALWPTGWIDKVNESDLTIKLVNRSTITLRGGDQPDSLRGVSLDCLVLDEAAYVTERIWSEVLRPTLSDSGGSALFISSPSGRDWFYELWKKGQEPEREKGWQSWQYTTIQGGNVPQEEIDAAKRDLDEKTFTQEYEASFVTYFGIIYYNFHPQESIQDRAYQKGKTVYIGLDFNIDPMSAVIAQKDGDRLYIIDEVVIFSSNTDEMADELRSRYPVEHCIIYPDPAAVQRRTSAGGKTDISILQNYGFRVRHRPTHPFVKDRINAVNSRLQSSDRNRHLFVHSKCRNTRESLAKMSYKEGTSVPNKNSGYDHLCFAGGQLVETERGVQKFSKIDPEGMIKTFNGEWVEYFHARQTGVKKTMTLYLKSGRTIECTPDHKIMTVHGFSEAQDLRIGEMMAGENRDYKPPKPSEREVREDVDDLYEDLPPLVKEKMAIDVLDYVISHREEVPVYCLYVPRWHCFQLAGGVIVSNCDALSYMVEYLYPVKRSGSSISSMRLSGL